MSELVKIHGLAELISRLRRLPIHLQKGIVRKGAGAGAQVFKQAAIVRSPIGSAPVKRGGGRVTQPGVLRSAVITKFLRSRSNDEQAFYIITYRRGKRAQRIGKGAVNKDAFYAGWVEHGHRIVPRTRRIGRDNRGRFKNATSIRSRAGAATGRVTGRKMLTNTFTSTATTALNTVTERIRSGFDAAVRSLR